MGQSHKWVANSNLVNTSIHLLLKNLLDAGTGQPGYLLTARDTYLEPYQNAPEVIDQKFALLSNLTRDNPAQQELLFQIKIQIQLRRDFPARAIALKKAGQDAEALRVVLNDKGKAAMDEIRLLTAAMTRHEELLLKERQLKVDSHARFSHHLSLSLMLLDTVALAAIVYMPKRMEALNRIVTVCAWSKTINSGGRWISFESYLREQFGISVSHGIS